MRKLYFLCLFFYLFSPILHAQTGLPQVYLIKTDTASFKSDDVQYYRMLADSSAKLTFQQVRSMQFSPVKAGGYVIRDFRTNVFWRTFTLKNTLRKTLSIAIPASLSRMDVYAVDSAGAVTHKIIGDDVPWSQRSGLKRFEQAVFSLQPGAKLTIYARLFINFKFDKNISDAPAFKVLKNEQQDTVDFYEERLKDVSILSFLCGIMIIASLVNLFFYTVSREKLYLYFALFGFFYALLAGHWPIYDIFLKEMPVLLRYNTLIALFCGFFLWKFLSVFYDAPSLYPRWYKFSNYLSYGIFGAAIPVLTNWTIGNIWLSVLLASISGLFLINSFIILSFSLFKSRQEKVFKLITALPFLFIGVIYIVADVVYRIATTKSGFLKFLYTHGGDMTLFFFYWLVIIFLWKMIQRFQKLQKQVLQEALEREVLARGHEAERLELIASQKIVLEQQVAERTAELHQSLTDLKQTQNQLVQSEKMASLGELTAGIAHEIQNPLNFVNNFSEVSIELLEELVEEAEAGHFDDVKDIAGDLTQNLQKINHHGKRADGIVKGMLQHSRTTGGSKEPTDLNKLADEYLRLAYHGHRARDKSFNAELITELGKGLPQVNVVPQDIGRVLLNLFTNAFYAVQQKQKTAGSDYKPTIQIKTFTPPSGGIALLVRDNGTGIPDSIKDKILQPFFTTKPTGEGTGLGLSLSYDIIVKAHGGKIAIESKEGDYTEFTISIPATT